MSEKIDQIRHHFCRETGKLTNWIEPPLRITDFCEENPDFYDQLKELNPRRGEKEITSDERYRLMGDLLRRHQRREVDGAEA